MNTVVKVVHTAPGHSQRKEISPGAAGCCQKEYILKYVKGVSCVTQLSCVEPVTNVKNIALNLPVGVRLQNFWQTWLDLGAGVARDNDSPRLLTGGSVSCKGGLKYSDPPARL